MAVCVCGINGSWVSSLEVRLWHQKDWKPLVYRIGFIHFNGSRRGSEPVGRIKVEALEADKKMVEGKEIGSNWGVMKNRHLEYYQENRGEGA